MPHNKATLQVDSWRKVRNRMGLPMDARGSDAQEMAAMAQAITREQLHQFVDMCRRRYEDKRIDPGKLSKAFIPWRASLQAPFDTCT